MRRTRLVKAPVHDVCVFCAHQLGIDTSVSRTSLNTINGQRRTLRISATARRQDSSGDSPDQDVSPTGNNAPWGGVLLSDEEAARAALEKEAKARKEAAEHAANQQNAKRQNAMNEYRQRQLDKEQEWKFAYTQANLQEQALRRMNLRNERNRAGAQDTSRKAGSRQQHQQQKGDLFVREIRPSSFNPATQHTMEPVNQTQEEGAKDLESDQPPLGNTLRKVGKFNSQPKYSNVHHVSLSATPQSSTSAPENVGTFKSQKKYSNVHHVSLSATPQSNTSAPPKAAERKVARPTFAKPTAQSAPEPEEDDTDLGMESSLTQEELMRLEAEDKAKRARQEEEARLAEQARLEEEVRKIEEDRKAEIERRAEEARKIEESRKAWIESKAEAARQADHARRAQEMRSAEAARELEAERRAAAERKSAPLKQSEHPQRTVHEDVAERVQPRPRFAGSRPQNDNDDPAEEPSEVVPRMEAPQGHSQRSSQLEVTAPDTTESKPAQAAEEVFGKPVDGLTDEEELMLQRLLAERNQNSKASNMQGTQTEPEEYQERTTETYKPFDPALTANWGILKRQPEELRDEAPKHALTPEEVNASFERHRQQRQAPSVDIRTFAMQPPPLSSATCYRCGQLGHLAKDCDNAPAPRCARCGHRGHTTSECTNRPANSNSGFCHVCKEVGHSASECSNRPADSRSGLRCNICKEVGHFASECPRRFCRICNQRGHSDRECPNAPRQREDSFSPSHISRLEAGSASPGSDSRELWRPEIDEEPSSRKSNVQRFEVERQIGQARHKQKSEVEDDTEDADLGERLLRSSKFTDAPARDRDRKRGGGSRRSRSDEDDDDVEARPRRSRDMFEESAGEDESRPRRRSRLDLEEDDEGSFDGLRQARDARKQARQAKKDKAAKEAERKAARNAKRAGGMTPIQLPEFISVSRLAQALGVKLEDFVDKIEDLGFANNSYDHILSAENAGLIALEYNFDASFGEEAEEEDRDLKARPEVDDTQFLPSRPPIVTIMGHVDHGKTTILDYLRKSSIAATEQGGITQHIGAFSVSMSGGKIVTFLDTPGHEAFLSMRQRGANVTDIVILVVAADDSVKPQTLEALKHARAAKVPIIVAINKVDKEEANIERVKQDLARHGVEIEDFGGDTQVVCVSGKTGQGMDELEEAAVTLSEILDHRADPSGPVEGWVIEATTKAQGRVATVLVRRGTLKTGDIVVAGHTWARVRALHNEAGVSVYEAGPGTPVEVDGWRDQPNAGDEVLQAPNEQKATSVVEYRSELVERKRMTTDMEAINEARRMEATKRAEAEAAAREAKDAQREEVEEPVKRERTYETEDLTVQPAHQTVPFIIKADVSGSVEAVTAYLLQMTNPLCSPTLLRAGVGPVSEFDIEHAAAANGHIIAFNLPSDPNSVLTAERQGVKLLEQNIIYRIVDDVKAVLEDKLPPLRVQRVLGEADVAMSFEISVSGRKKLKIAGCKVRNGQVGRGSRVRVLRGGVGGKKVYDGIITSLKNVKKDVQEMRKGTECGMAFEGWEDFQEGDVVQTYEEKQEKRPLNI